MLCQPFSWGGSWEQCQKVPWQLKQHLHSQSQLQEQQSKFPDGDGTMTE